MLKRDTVAGKSIQVQVPTALCDAVDKYAVDNYLTRQYVIIAALRNFLASAETQGGEIHDLLKDIRQAIRQTNFLIERQGQQARPTAPATRELPPLDLRTTGERVRDVRARRVATAAVRQE